MEILKMLVLISITFIVMKIIVTIESYRTKPFALSTKQWLMFCFGWAGMRPQLFEYYGQRQLEGGREMIFFGLKRIIVGVLLLCLAHQLIFLNTNPTVVYWLTSVVLLVAFSLILHFGLLSISAGILRFKGVNAGYLFKSPLKSRSLTEFWSKRWNLAFSEMVAIVIFKPLKNKIGQIGAVLAGFAFSGILHELALSLPVSTGYGLPFLYFLIQGILVILEKVLLNHQIYILQRPVIGKIWTLFWVIVPAPLLFHDAFIQQVVWPLAGITHISGLQ
jgi:hypothetical protein